MPAPERLQVGAVGQRALDLHEHVAPAGDRIRNLLDAQVARRRGSARPSRRRTRPSAPRRDLKSSSPSSKRSSGNTVGSGTSSVGQQRSRVAHRLRRRGARADDGQLAPVDGVARDRARVREDEHEPAGPDGVERGVAGAARADDRGVDRAVRRAAGARGIRVDDEDVVAAPPSTAAKSPPTKPLPTTSTRPRGTRAAPRSTHASGSTIVARASSSASGISTPAVRDAFREAARHDRRVGELLAGRLVPRAAARALAARPVMDEREPPLAVATTTSWPSTRPALAGSPSFSTSEPQRPHARTSTAPSGSGASASRGRPFASSTTARTRAILGCGRNRDGRSVRLNSPHPGL